MIGAQTGCGYDHQKIWTSSRCDDGKRAFTIAGNPTAHYWFGHTLARRGVASYPKQCTQIEDRNVFVRCCADQLAIDCTVSSWAPWTECSKLCGGGTQSRTRNVMTQAQRGGLGCPSVSESRGCNTEGCTEASCKVSAWLPWKSCSVRCGGGTQFRNRKQRCVGAKCPPADTCPMLSESRKCSTQPCTDDTCLVSDWQPYTDCSKPCEGGVQRRQRTVERNPKGNYACPELLESRKCNTQGCGHSCKVSEWGQYNSCSNSCGGGTHTRSRVIDKPAIGGGMPCPNLQESAVCGTRPCQINCELSAWAQFDQCTAPCAGGTQLRTR